MRVAAIDCGTNSIRLLIADSAPDGGLEDLVREMRIVRLGQGVDKTGHLAPEAIERTLAATREYKGMIDAHGVPADAIRFVATSASRDADNAAEFEQGVRDILGIVPEVIPGTEEASLSFRGAASRIRRDLPRPLMVVDIGGGSTELVIGDTDVRHSISINMGSVRVTERFLGPEHDPAAEARAEEWIDQQIAAAQASGAVDLSEVGTIVGVAGTVTTVTAQALGLTSYQPERIDGSELGLDQVEDAIRFMVEQPIAVKAALGFMPAGREDVIAAGALIWRRVIAATVAAAGERGHAIDMVVTSEHDILDGIALSILD